VRHKIKCAISGGAAGCREERTDRAKAKIKASPMKRRNGPIDRTMAIRRGRIAALHMICAVTIA
jgi:hypothetical protein